ncbi:MAG: orotidine-5'-phosphate decarboxylase [Nitrospinota bacterium]|nr:orotidine-5'-phosphate decarboxylase [Nitrospinota bacterium]
MNQPKDKLIAALDVDSQEEAMAAVERMEGALAWVKVGARLFSATGPSVVGLLKQQGLKVFLDLKFHDIPATVASACANAVASGADMINVHALGGRAMMAEGAAAARNAAKASGHSSPIVIAVTVLTSMGPEDLRLLGFNQSPEELALHLACEAKAAGLDGVVASAHEVAAIKKVNGPDFVVVTPGIRPAWASVDDQKRIMTPAQALGMGADFLVVGRPIFAAADPKAAALQTLKEMEEE